LDAQIYHVVWFVRGRWEGGQALLSEFDHLTRWEESIQKHGHGKPESMTGEEAIQVAAASVPATTFLVDDNDPQGLKEGQSVTVCPDVQSKEQSVEGTVRIATAATIAIDRTCEETNTIVCVHFPRTGYRVETDG